MVRREALFETIREETSTRGLKIEVGVVGVRVGVNVACMNLC
jgi:hypothetical protein